MHELEWDWVGIGEWEAASALRDGNSSFLWHIEINEYGEFMVDCSSPKLASGHVGAFTTLKDAKAWCQAREHELVRGAECAEMPHSATRIMRCPDCHERTVDTCETCLGAGLVAIIPPKLKGE